MFKTQNKNELLLFFSVLVVDILVPPRIPCFDIRICGCRLENSTDFNASVK